MAFEPLMDIDSFGKALNENSFEGKVVKVDHKKFTFTVKTDTGRFIPDCIVMKDGGYSLPEEADSVIVSKISETGKVFFVGHTARPNYGDPGPPATEGNREKRELAAHEFTRQDIGADEKGSAKNGKRDCKQGDTVLFDKSESYAKAFQTGEFAMVLSNILQVHFIKRWNQFQLFFRRLLMGWSGGELQLGDFAPNADKLKYEDFQLKLFSDSLRYKGHTLNINYGHNCGSDLKKPLIYIERKAPNSDEGNVTMTKFEENELGETRLIKKDKDGRNLLSMGFDPDSILEINTFDHGELKFSFSVDIKTGDVEVSTKGNIKIDTTGNCNIDTKGQTTVVGNNISINGGGNLALS